MLDLIIDITLLVGFMTIFGLIGLIITIAVRPQPKSVNMKPETNWQWAAEETAQLMNNRPSPCGEATAWDCIKQETCEMCFFYKELQLHDCYYQSNVECVKSDCKGCEYDPNSETEAERKGTDPCEYCWYLGTETCATCSDSKSPLRDDDGDEVGMGDDPRVQQLFEDRLDMDKVVDTLTTGLQPKVEKVMHIWADGTWCEPKDLESMGWMSDDYFDLDDSMTSERVLQILCNQGLDESTSTELLDIYHNLTCPF